VAGSRYRTIRVQLVDPFRQIELYQFNLKLRELTELEVITQIPDLFPILGMTNTPRIMTNHDKSEQGRGFKRLLVQSLGAKNGDLGFWGVIVWKNPALSAYLDPA